MVYRNPDTLVTPHRCCLLLIYHLIYHLKNDEPPGGGKDNDGASGIEPGWMIALAGIGYFTVCTLFGMAAFALGSALAVLEMQMPAFARTVPVASGMVVLIAGALQFTAWKAHHLACCRVTPGHGCTSQALQALQIDTRTAWRHGLRLGLDCSTCCASLTAVLRVTGVMDMRIMAAVTAVITIEPLAPDGEHAARAVGMLVVAAGLIMLVRVMGLA